MTKDQVSATLAAISASDLVDSISAWTPTNSPARHYITIKGSDRSDGRALKVYLDEADGLLKVELGKGCMSNTIRRAEFIGWMLTQEVTRKIGGGPVPSEIYARVAI